MTDIVHMPNYTTAYRFYTDEGDFVLDLLLCRSYAPKLAWTDYRSLSYKAALTWWHKETGVMHRIEDGEKSTEGAVKKMLSKAIDESEHWHKTMCPEALKLSKAMNEMRDVNHLYEITKGFCTDTAFKTQEVTVIM